MKPWSVEQTPPGGNARPRRAPGVAPEQNLSNSGRPMAGPLSRDNPQISGDWAREPPPFYNQAQAAATGYPPDAAANVSRPLAGGPAEPPPAYEMPQPAIPLSRFGRATGLSLKLRFLLALTLLSLAPAFLLVLLYQQANQASLAQAGQQTLIATAHANSKVLTKELANRQAHLASLAQQSSIEQASRSGTNIQQAENLLAEAGLSTRDTIAWMVLNGSDRIMAAAPASLEGQTLSSSDVLAHPDTLESFVQAQRAAPAPKPGQTILPVASGADDGISDKGWVATLAFISPAAPAHSGAVLAIFSLPALVNTYFSAFPDDPHSFACLFDTKGTILGVAGNQKLAKQIGQPLAITPLQNTIQTLQAGQSSNALTYDDPTTGVQEMVGGILNKNLGMVFLVAAPPDDLAIATTGLLQARNLPLIFLSIIVVTTLVATWVALPIVRPIRRATREILASTDDVRLLAEQAKQIAKDQRLGTDILEGAAKGLDMRRRAIGRDATLIVNSATAAATRLAQLAHTISELPDPLQAPMQILTREIYQELQTTHQLAAGISSGLESDPAQKRLGSVMEGAAEISQQFDQASQQLQHGASRLERAAEALE
jgi:hypothetical protein